MKSLDEMIERVEGGLSQILGYGLTLLIGAEAASEAGIQYLHQFAGWVEAMIPQVAGWIYGLAAVAAAYVTKKIATFRKVQGMIVERAQEKLLDARAEANNFKDLLRSKGVSEEDIERSGGLVGSEVSE